MGRPKLAQDTKRSIPLAAKFTPAERARLLVETERLGLSSLSDLLRQRVLTGRVVVRKSAELAAADRVALQRVGVNLNQLARHLNERAGDLPAIVAISSEITDTLRELNALLLRAADGS